MAGLPNERIGRQRSGRHTGGLPSGPIGIRQSGRLPGGLLLIVLGLAAAGLGIWTIVKVRDRAAPVMNVRPEAAAIGREMGRIRITAEEPKYGIRDLRATLVQGSLEVPLGEVSHRPPAWWRFGRGPIEPVEELIVEVGLERIPELKEGTALIRAEATNGSWARLGKGRTSVVENSFTVLLTPPRLEILSSQHYINQGGSECVVYRVSETAVESGVMAGDYFFRGYPRAGGARGERFAIFAFPYDLPSTTVPILVARDAAGNEAKAPFNHKVFPRSFRQQTLEVTDSLLGRVVPPILSHTPFIQSQGDLLEDFLEINGRLRRVNAARLIEIGGDSRPEKLWKGAFIQLGSSKVEASFADHRTYLYKGQVIDKQDHLGFDLAATANYPIGASNDGVVMLATYFGIYGNTVIIDHGCGVMTLYSHLSSMEVKSGDTVERGEMIGRSGATGLAGGDHLHFSVLIQGVPVNPIEWWDPRWVANRIESKISPSPPSEPAS